MKSFNFINQKIRCGSGESTKFLRFATVVLVLFVFGVGSTWAGSSYYSRFTAKTAKVDGVAAGLVYAASEDSEGAINAYQATYQPSADDGSSGEEFTWYAWAKAGRGFEFVAWTKGSNINSNGDLNSAATTFGVLHSTSDDGYVDGDATATFQRADAYTVTFKQPTNFGAYSIEYSNVSVNAAGTAFEDYETHDNMTTSSVDKVEISYATDKITIEVTARTNDFLGWYDGDTKVSDKLSYSFQPTGDMTISGRWKVARPNIPMTFKAVENDKNGNPKGSYTVGDVTVESEDYVTSSGSTYYLEKTLTATPATGYAFTGWYTLDGKKKNFISYDNPFEAYFDAEVTLYANFTYSGYDDAVKAKFKVGSTEYFDLNEANAAAVAGSNKTIICVQDGILVPGNYTISKNVTLLIPYNETINSNQTRAKQVNEPLSALGAYRTLVLAEGTNIIVNGNLCVSGQIASRNQDNADGRSGFPSGACGMIDMSQGGCIELNNGAVLYAWGIIKGQDKANGNNTVGVGTINAHKGSTIWEDFQVGDFRGGTACSNLNAGASTWKFFPFQSYNVCNIEVPIIYEFGATEWCYTSLRTQNNSTEFKLVASEETLFLLKDKKSQLRKWYDPTTDQMCYEMSGTTKLDAIRISVIIYDINSANFNLPISSNMRIIMSNTDMTLSTPVQVQAGAALEVKDDAHVTVDTDIYLFDNNEWDKWVNNRYFRSLSGMSAHKDRGDGESKTSLGTGQMIINGTVTVSENGHIYTSASGAEVIGNGGGTIIFEGELPAGKNITMFKSTTIDNANAEAVPMTAANLCNDDGSYTKSVSGATFHNVKGRWFIDGKEGEKADHTYDFTYMAEGNTGDEVHVSALYGADKTGLTAGERWANVEQDATCTETYNCLQDLNDYTADKIKYIYPSNAWLQLIKTNTEGVYSGSDNNLYGLEGCTFTASDPIDENCLYTLGGVKKALVGGAFIPVVANELDAAYHQADDESKFYLCFQGCNWHPATPYVNEDSQTEPKAYVVDEGIYIWYNGDWMLVQREDPFFYTEDPQSSIKTYYEYVDGEWMIAAPYVRVADAYGEATFYSFADAIADASAKKNTTITVLRDITEEAAAFSYASGNTSCIIDLNGHTVDMDVTGRGDLEIKMFRINTPSGTVTITDNSLTKNGELRLKAKITTSSATKRWSGIGVDNGTLVMENGKVYVENHFPHTSTSNTGIVSGIQLAPGAKFTMNNGYLEATGRYNVMGVQTLEGNGSVITINEGSTIDAKTITETTVYGIYAYGTVNIHGGTINATSKKTTSYGVYVLSAADNSKLGTFNMDGGIIEAKATTTTYGVQIGWNYTMNSSQPNTIRNRYYTTANISGGTIKATNTSGGTAEGIRSYGTTNISGGEVIVRPAGASASGLRILAGTTTVTGSASFDAEATNTAYGVWISEATPGNNGVVYNGELVMNGGSFKVKTTTGATSYGVYVSGGSKPQSQAYDSNHTSYYKGNYANAGTATINSGTFDVIAKTTDAYAFFVKDTIKQAGVTDKAEAKATPKCTVNGGKFKVTSTNGSSSIYAANDAAQAANFKVKGGYFNKTTLNNSGNLSKYIVSPKTAIALTIAEGNYPDENYPEYTHKVAEAYLITFRNEASPEEERVLQSTLQNAGTAAVYNGLEPRKDDDGDNSYEFDGWATKIDGDVVVAKGEDLPNVSGAVTYYAHFATTAKKYIITWNANGGACATELTRVEATGSATVGELPDASKVGHDFDGWYTDAEGGDNIYTNTTVTGHVTYYAHYTVHSHTLTWSTDGDALSGDYTGKNGKVDFGAEIVAPNTPTKTGYTFAGWNTTPAATMPDNDLTYTAQWTPKTDTEYKVKHYKQNAARDGYDEPEVVSNTGTTGAWVTPATTSYEGFKTPATKTQQIAADGSMVVEYYYDRITYTIVFDANGGTCDQTPVTINYGETLGLDEMPNASKAGNDFDAWYTKAVGGDKVTTETTFKWNIGTIYAQFIPLPTIELGEASEETQTISGNSTVTDVIVHTQGHLEVSSGTLTTTNLYLEADASASGEIIGNVMATNAYFDLILNTESRHWRAFSVPFEIDLKQHPILADGVSMPLGVQYDIVYYDGSVRAAQGKVPDCWHYVEDDADWTLIPGRAYMIVFGRNVNTVRFTKKAGAPIAYAGEFAVNKNTATTGVASDGGWNGIGNPATYHTLLDAGVMECQVHNGEAINSDGYTLYDLTGKLVVGKAVFVQVGSSQAVDVMHAGTEPVIAAKAPRRTRTKARDERIDVQIAPLNGEMNDRIFILAAEEKEDRYVILHDIAKAGISAVRAQMWVDRYGQKLCKNTTALVNDKATYPLGMCAPTAGEYEITVNTQRDDVDIYLTLDGRVIWNLSYGGYVANLEKGTTNRYGLRVVSSARIPTGVEEATIENGEPIRKVMIDNKVYIIRNGKMYTVTGQVVE